MMAYRNTPDRDTSRSPAEVLFGRLLRDHLPNPGSRYKPREEWRLLARDRESALAKRAARNSEELTRGTRDLGKLTLGAHVRVQNQTGEKPTRWDNTGVVVEVKGFDQYVVKMDGTGRLSMRNRKFLRKFIPYGKSDPITQYHDMMMLVFALPREAPSPIPSVMMMMTLVFAPLSQESQVMTIMMEGGR